MVEGARLESVYTFIAYRGFESPSVRQNSKALAQQCAGAFCWVFFTGSVKLIIHFQADSVSSLQNKMIADWGQNKISAGLDSVAFASPSIWTEAVFRVAARRREMIAGWRNRNAR